MAVKPNDDINNKAYTIAIAGMGYVGLSLACLLSQHNDVRAFDIVESKVRLLNNWVSPIKDAEIESYLASRPGTLSFTTDANAACAQADFVVIATPTNYDPERNTFDTSSIESVLDKLANINSTATIVIKSTVPVGYTQQIVSSYPSLKVLFSPEFLREGHALYDNLHPSRIVVGSPHANDSSSQEELNTLATTFAELLASGAEETPGALDKLIMGSTEAEAVKLFSNTYLALRVSYFNELDTYAAIKGLDAAEIIKGVALDPRIGDFYNNPSFGYGGYCLPKDSKQLLANFDGVPQNIIRAIVDSNATRKAFIAESVLALHPKRVGIYRLVMKTGSDNFRESSIQTVISLLKDKGTDMLIYEPTCQDKRFMDIPVTDDFEQLVADCDIILANRMSPELVPYKDKVFTRDVWQRD